MPIAESLAVAALTWVASPVVKNLVDKSIAFLGSDIAKSLEDFETTLLPELQLTIQAAQNSTDPEAETALIKWLTRLKGAYIEAEGILHKLEYKNLKRKARVAGDRSKNILVCISSYPIVKPLAKFIGKVSKKVFLLYKLRRRLNKLKKIAAQAKSFRELQRIETENAGNGTSSGSNPPITSSHLSHEVFGRDAVRDQIINVLLDEEGASNFSSSSTIRRSYSVVAITGIGGAGKTTLAQYVYKDERVKQHFDIKMWVCLSRNFDVTGCTKEMIESASGGDCPNLSNLDTLKNKLTETLTDAQKILLVLDDVWYDKQAGNEQWDNLLAPFYSIRERCKILAISRSKLFPVALRPGKHIKLKDLAHHDFQNLFMYYAFLGTEIKDQHLKNALENIGKQIAKKMSKSPLAAKVIGNQLSEQPTIGFWRDTLNNVTLSSTRKILLWSYQRLNVSQQRCFLFCGMFPKGYSYSSQYLTKLWVALDFIQLATNDKRIVEDIGVEYFQMMVANSIFRKVNGKYVMHDLFHDLAEKLSAADCFRVIDYSEKLIPPTTLHLYLRGNNENLKGNLSSICKPNNLHTLFLINPIREGLSEIFSMVCNNFKNLRVFKIQLMGWKKLPTVVGDLRNLRYLDVGLSSIEDLPDSICQLYHLQYLRLPESVKVLPERFNNLINLRTINIIKRNGSIVYTLPPLPKVGRLTSLQALNKFHVRTEEGYELPQLGCLREIGGLLSIVGLENVRGKDEAIAARLIDRPKLARLELLWSGSGESIASEVDVIEALRPPTNLEGLKINGYRGSVCPTWLQEGSILPYLQSIAFGNCNALKALPLSFGQFCHCRELILKNLGALKELPVFSTNLAELCINKCPCLLLLCENELQQQVDGLPSIVGSGFQPSAHYPWKDIFETEVKSFEQTGSIENCHEQLEIIKSAIIKYNLLSEKWEDVVGRAWWPCHKQRMNFISCGIARSNKLELPVRLCIFVLSYCCISDGALSNSLRDMASLRKLKLEGIMTITTLPPVDVLQTLQNLQDLEICHCWCLRSLGGLHALPHLQKINVRGCWGLEIKNHDCALLPPTLQTVIIKDSIISENIFHANFLCLQNVEIYDCHVPVSLSFHHLNSLQTLILFYCSSLRSIKLCPVIGTLELTFLPNLDVQSVLESWQGCQQLNISSSLMLNELLLSQNFVAPTIIVMPYCQEEVISFKKSVHLQSIKKLGFVGCKAKNLSTTSRDFSNLESIGFENCLEMSELPELPSSMQRIKITNCPVLRERCQPNGPDWHKIKDIKNKWIE